MIFGIRKLSLVDYPKHPSFVIFLGGCNFHCPYCHNEQIVDKESEILKEDEVLEMIQNRIGFIDAVVVTGGEPTIYQDKLLVLLRKLRKTKLLIKLDTNGTNPDLLKKIYQENLVDYVAMDIKNTFEKYPITIGCKTNIDKIKQSIQLIEESGIDYEFRTTINQTMHKKEDIQEIITYIKNKERYFIQPYLFSEYQIEPTNFGEFTNEELESFEDITSTLIKN